MTDKATQIIATTMARHPLLGSGCLCGDGPTKYDPAAQDAHLVQVIRAALAAVRIELVEHPEPEPGWVAAFREDGHPYVFPGREYTVTVWPAYPDEVKISHRGEPLDEPIPATEARALAAALLAAAHTAETQHTPQER